MRAALSLARRGLGSTWPNPSVGCVVLDQHGAVTGRGWTQKGGRPHAEARALDQAGKTAHGGTAYVTFEPCAHHGQTPPCSDALIASGIRRCVVAIQDPDPRVSGAGIKRLRESGVDVVVGPMADEATDLNLGFLTRIAAGRPMLALKLATTLDGKVAMESGESRWITGEPARNFGHQLRACHDAILVGSGTILADDPDLTCRLPGLSHRSPVRIALDRRGRIPATARILAAGGPPTWIMTTDRARIEPRISTNKGLQVIEIVSNNDSDDWLNLCLKRLGDLGLTRVLVEGGQEIASAFLRVGAVDRLYWFRSAGVVGRGRDAFRDLGLTALAETRRFRRRGLHYFGDDVLEVLDLAP